MNGFLNIHLFADVSSSKEAYYVGAQLSKTLTPFGKVQICNIKRYWKIPEYFEFSIELRSPSLNQSICHEIAKVLGVSWVEAGGSYIWAASEKNEFTHPSVKWANLELVEVG